MSEVKVKNLHQRLVEVMRTMGAVGKGGKTNYGDKFEYHRIDDVDAALREALVEHGVVALMVNVGDRQSERHLEVDKYNNPRTLYQTECVVTIRFFNADDPADTVDIVGWGQGLDYQDKATGKAISYAAKSAYLSSLHLRGQPDNEADNIPAPVVKNAPATVPPPAKPAATKPAAPKPSVQIPKKAELPDYDSLPPKARECVDGVRGSDGMSSLLALVPGFKKETREVQDLIKPYFDEQKKVCYANDISRCQDIAALKKLGAEISAEKNADLFNTLKSLYAAQDNALKARA